LLKGDIVENTRIEINVEENLLKFHKFL
jgi:hypothetical protein